MQSEKEKTNKKWTSTEEYRKAYDNIFRRDNEKDKKATDKPTS